jgi:class 3 adenylate cyclase
MIANDAAEHSARGDSDVGRHLGCLKAFLNCLREYTIVGSVLNLAARLMQAAPGEVLCDAATARAAGTRIK